MLIHTGHVPVPVCSCLHLSWSMIRAKGPWISLANLGSYWWVSSSRDNVCKRFHPEADHCRYYSLDRIQWLTLYISLKTEASFTLTQSQLLRSLLFSSHRTVDWPWRTTQVEDTHLLGWWFYLSAVQGFWFIILKTYEHSFRLIINVVIKGSLR